MSKKDSILNVFSSASLIAEDKIIIPYRKSLNTITGNPLSSILLGQILYWAEKYNFAPFFKFRKPPGFFQNETQDEYLERVNPYKLGDSWCEELDISPKEFDSALKRIAHKRNESPQKKEQKIIYYWTDRDNLTWYEVDLEILDKLMAERGQKMEPFPPKFSRVREEEKTWDSHQNSSKCPNSQKVDSRKTYASQAITDFSSSPKGSPRIPPKGIRESTKGESEEQQKGNSPNQRLLTEITPEITSDVILRKITLRTFPKTEKFQEPSALNLGSEKAEIGNMLKEKESLPEGQNQEGFGRPNPSLDASRLSERSEDSLKTKEMLDEVEEKTVPEKEENFIGPAANTHSHEPVPELPKESPPVERSRRGWSFSQNMPMSVSVRPEFERKEGGLQRLPLQQKDDVQRSPQVNRKKEVSSQEEVSQTLDSSTPYTSPEAPNLNEKEEQIGESYPEQQDLNSGAFCGLDRSRYKVKVQGAKPKPLFISQDTQEILARWNNSGVLQKTTIDPEKPSKTLKDTVSAIKSLFKGNFFQNLEGLEEYNKEFTKEDIYLSIDRFIKKVSSPEYNSKAWMRKTGLLNFFYYQGPTEQKGVQRSLFLQYLLEEPKKNGCKEVSNPDEYTMSHLKKAFEDYVYNGVKLTLSVYDKNKLARGAELLIKAMQDYAPLAIMSIEECAVKTVKGLLWRYEKLEKEVHIGMLGEELTYHKTLIEYLSHIRRI